MAVHFLRRNATIAAVVLLAAGSVALAGNPATRSNRELQNWSSASALHGSATAVESSPMGLWQEPESCACATADCGCTGGDGSSWCSPRWYGQADLLIWWTKGNHVPALVTTSPDDTVRDDAGVLGVAGTEVLAGGAGIDGNYRPGGRLTVGHWLDDCRSRGVEVTWFSLGDGANSGNFYAQSVGDPLSPMLVRPFYNVGLVRQDGQLVAFPNVVEGDVQVLTGSEMHSVAALLRRNVSESCGSRIDVVGGYRFLRYRESLTIREHLNSTDPGGAVAVGTTFDIVDAFGAENSFHGGEIGLSTILDHECWSLDVLTKVALGNMHEQVAIRGATVIGAPTQAPVVANGGLLALPTNSGDYSRDRFALVPELNVNFHYFCNDCVSLTLGYSVLWITDVARTGDQIDLAVNTSQLPSNGGNLTGPANPQAVFGHTSMWAQGINLGVTFEY